MKRYSLLILINLIGFSLLGQSGVVEAANRVSKTQGRFNDSGESFMEGYNKAKNNSSNKPSIQYFRGEKSIDLETNLSKNRLKPRYIDFTGFIGQCSGSTRKSIMRSAQNWSFEPIRTSKPSRWNKNRPKDANAENTLFCEVVRSVSRTRLSSTEIEINTAISVNLRDSEGILIFNGDFKNYSYDEIFSEIFKYFK